VKRLVVKKTKAKEWFTIIAPKLFGEKEIGKTHAIEASNIIGRRINVSVVELSDDFSKYYMKFSFKITRIEGNKAFTEFDGSECLRDYISRMVVRRVRRIDTVQDLKTKDGKHIMVKGIAILSRRVKSSIQKAIASKIKEMVKELVESMNLEDFIQKLLTDEMKNRILQQAKKIYPVRNFEFRKIEAI